MGVLVICIKAEIFNGQVQEVHLSLIKHAVLDAVNRPVEENGSDLANRLRNGP